MSKFNLSGATINTQNLSGLEAGSPEVYQIMLTTTLTMMSDVQRDRLCFDLYVRSPNKEKIQERIKNYINE